MSVIINHALAAMLSPMGAWFFAMIVTSAWHMRRAKLMFEKYAPELEIIPAACDHEATLGAAEPLQLRDFFPGGEALMRNGYFVKEIIDYWGYRLRGW